MTSRSSIAVVTAAPTVWRPFTSTASADAGAAATSSADSARTMAGARANPCAGMRRSKAAAEAEEHLQRAGHGIGAVTEIEAEIVDADAPSHAFQPRRVERSWGRAP